jgi:hypothetical protein
MLINSRRVIKPSGGWDAIHLNVVLVSQLDISARVLMCAVVGRRERIWAETF